MIVITGATGKLGQHVIASLLKPCPQPHRRRRAQSPRPPTWPRRACKCARPITTTAPASTRPSGRDEDPADLVERSGAARAQHQNVIDAARRAGVALLAYTSVLRADTRRWAWPPST